MSTPIREINPESPPQPLDDAVKAEIVALAERQARAGRGLMRIVNLAGDRVESGMRMLPKPARARIEIAARGALSRSYDVASRTRAPGGEDDGIDTAFLGARLGLSGVAVNRLISRVAPRFATVLGQKLAGQAVPILGAAAGAGTNYAFIDYYVEVAHMHFGLRRLARLHGEERVLESFHAALDCRRMPTRR